MQDMASLGLLEISTREEIEVRKYLMGRAYLRLRHTPANSSMQTLAPRRSDRPKETVALAG